MNDRISITLPPRSQYRTDSWPGKITDEIEKGRNSWHNSCAIKRLSQSERSSL